MKDARQRPVYPTWIRSSRIRLFWLLAAVIVVIAAIASALWRPGLAIAVVALPFAYIGIVIAMASYRLSPRGDDLQARIHQLIIDEVGTGGRLLDVGCGSGQLIVKFARAQPGDYVGLDFWPDEWGQYAKAQAEHNAQLEGVPGIEFVHGSASKLPFDDASFSRVVSCLTFHEVKDVRDKATGPTEAIRVLKPGGRFAFVDLFDDPGAYHGRERVIEAITKAGGELESARCLSEIVPLKWPMDTGKALKYAVVVAGMKRMRFKARTLWWHGTPP
jgi:ubiquinone/menaquinone biosynthesis C-methylase UbiE